METRCRLLLLPLKYFREWVLDWMIQHCSPANNYAGGHQGSWHCRWWRRNFRREKTKVSTISTAGLVLHTLSLKQYNLASAGLLGDLALKPHLDTRSTLGAPLARKTSTGLSHGDGGAYSPPPKRGYRPSSEWHSKSTTSTATNCDTENPSWP